MLEYTVDFHWGNVVDNMPGGSGRLLSALLYILGIDEITIDDVADVRFFDPSLLRVEQVDGDTGRAIWEALKAGELAADGAEQPAAQAIGDDASPDPEAAISEDVNGAEMLSDPTVESAMLRIKAICPGNPASTSSTACRQAGMICWKQRCRPERLTATGARYSS